MLTCFFGTVTSRPNKNEFEPTIAQIVSDIACVGSYPTLQVESESYTI